MCSAAFPVNAVLIQFRVACGHIMLVSLKYRFPNEHTELFASYALPRLEEFKRYTASNHQLK